MTGLWGVAVNEAVTLSVDSTFWSFEEIGSCWLHMVEYMLQYLPFCFCFDGPKNLVGF
jgi:hypothetical protein